MSLNIYSYYQTFKPHFSYRFKVDFLANPSLSRLVKDIKLPSISINASDGRKRFGNTQIVLPFFEFGDQEIEITFVETDDMKVLQHLTAMLNWPNNPIEEVINVTEYDDTLRNVIHVTEYVIAIYSFNSPQWQNAGGGSNKMDLSATYVVRSVRDITKEDQSGLYELPYWAPQPNIKQDLNMIGSSVDEGVSEDEWNKFLDSLYNPASKIEAPLTIPPSGGDPNPQNSPAQTPEPQQQQDQKPVKPAPSPINNKKYSQMTEAEQKAYLRELLKNEISGKATNGHSRKEGNDNQVYSNPFDSKKYNPTQMNYGYGNTYEKLKALGADKVGPIKFKVKKDMVIDGKKYKAGEEITFANLTAANNALKDEKFGNNSIVLDQASADKLNNLVLDDMANKMQKTFKDKGIEEVIDNMNQNAQMGLTHMIYGGEGTMKNVAENLRKNKKEAIDSLQQNGGYLGNDFVDKHKNDKGSTYKSTNAKTGATMSWNRLDYMSEKGKTIVRTPGTKTA